MVKQRLIHRWHTWQCSRLDARNCLQHCACLKARQHRDHSACKDCPVEHAGIGEDVEEGQRANNSITHLNLGINTINLSCIGGEVLMRQHRALGRARRPARILDECNIALSINRNRGWLCRGVAKHRH